MINGSNDIDSTLDYGKYQYVIRKTFRPDIVILFNEFIGKSVKNVKYLSSVLNSRMRTRSTTCKHLEDIINLLYIMSTELDVGKIISSSSIKQLEHLKEKVFKNIRINAAGNTTKDKIEKEKTNLDYNMQEIINLYRN